MYLVPRSRKGDIMGLFTRKIGPVFLKSSNQAKEYVDKLRELKEQCSDELKEEIEKQITIAEYGIKGEECIAFELKNSGTVGDSRARLSCR